MQNRPTAVNRTNARHVARILGMTTGDLVEEIRRRRDNGQGWQQIADDLNGQAGITISRYSYYRWAPDPDGWTPTARPARKTDRVGWNDQRQLAALAARMRRIAARYPHLSISDDLTDLAGRVDQYAPPSHPVPSQATARPADPAPLPSRGGVGTLDQ